MLSIPEPAWRVHQSLDDQATVVEQWPHHYKVEGSYPAATLSVGAGKEKNDKKNDLATFVDFPIPIRGFQQIYYIFSDG